MSDFTFLTKEQWEIWFSNNYLPKDMTDFSALQGGYISVKFYKENCGCCWLSSHNRNTVCVANLFDR